MQKVLWMSHLLPYPPKGGVLQRSYNLIKEASKYFEITLVAFNQSNLCRSEAELQEAYSHLSQFCKVVEVTPIASEAGSIKKIILLIQGLLPTTTYTVSWLNSSEYKKKIEDEFDAAAYDLIHVDTISLVPYALPLQNVKKVLNHHNIESLMILRRAENEKNFLKKFYFFQEGIKLKRYEQKICDEFDLHVTCSNLDSARLKELCPNSDCIDIPNGVDIDYFTPQSTYRIKNSLIFAGGLSWYPNLDAMSFFLKEVWPKLVNEVPDVTMTVIGRSPPDWMKELEQQYSGLTVTGFVDDVRPYFDKASVYVCPIRDGGGTKLKVLDALAMQIPLIANPIACEGIDVESGVNVLFATTADEYISQIKKALSDDSMRDMIGNNGRILIQEKYNFQEIGKKLRNIYLDLIGK